MIQRDTNKQAVLDVGTFGALVAMLGMPEMVSTNEAAKLLNRKPQTLRKWASSRTGPIEPVRINGRLHWRRTDIIGLLNGGTTK